MIDRSHSWRYLPHLARRAALGVAVAAVLAAPAAALAQSGTKTDEAQPAQVLNIDVGEMYFQLQGQDKNAPITLAAGTTYTLVFHNLGAVLHEIQFGRDPGTDSNGQPHDYQTLLFDGVESTVKAAGAATVSDTLAEIQLDKGASAELTFTLPATTTGDWEIGCFQPGHYQAGMHAPIVVQ